jgi:glyoxylase-like metal-dependent hydrolase (beta-lactamase superfamily II)
MKPDSLIQYTHDELPLPGETLEVAPGVHWLRMSLPYALDHINLWLLEDGPRWAIVDTGLGNAATRELWRRQFELRLKPGSVSRVVVTHHHPDHLGNAGWLAGRFGVPMWMSQGDFLTAHALLAGAAGHSRKDVVEMYRRNGLDDETCTKLIATGNHYPRAVPEMPSDYRRLMEGDVLSIGALKWRVIMGYGHAPEHAALYCESLGVLIAGDMVLPRISTNVSVPSSQPEGDPLRLFLNSIANYAKLPADTLVLPSHGKPFRGLRERAAALEEHHRLRLAELREACATPKSAAEVLSTLFKRPLDTHQMLFAMGEAMAHLHYLYADGLLERSDTAGVLRYAAT